MFLIAFGTRPEFNKLKPIVEKMEEMKIPYRLVCTGQHKELLSSDSIPYERLTENFHTRSYKSENRLDSIVESTIWHSFGLFDSEYSKHNKIEYVIVQGDTTSAFAFALCAFHRKIPVIHIEAGMRSDNVNPYPEEFNRRAISAIASYHFCPTDIERTNLVVEGIRGTKYVVGNSGLDNIVDIKGKTSYQDKVIITMHRRENQSRIVEWFEALEALAIENPEYEFIFPMHPSPKIQEHKYIFEYVKVVEPMNHDDFVDLLKDVSCVITDSGGVQEESTFLGKKVFCCRKVEDSERKEDELTTFVREPYELLDLFSVEKNKFHLYKNYHCPYGEGNTAQKICEILEKMVV